MSESEGPTRENSVSRTFNLVHPEHHPATGLQSFTLAQRINSAFGSFRERKNKQSDVFLRSEVGGLRVASKGQLEIDKNIWDLTKGVQVEEHKASPFQRAWEALCQDAKTVVRTVRRDPLVALIPLLLLILLLGGGLWAVFASAAKETQHRREVAQQVVRDKGLYLQTELAKAFLPAYVCSVYVRRDPSWPTVNRTFAPMAMEMIRLSNAGSVLTLSLIPNGIIYTMVPLLGTGPKDDANWRAIGKDWLQDKFNQDKVHQAISTRNLTIIGPYNLTQGGIGLVAMLTINIAGANASATFDVPPLDYSTLPWQNSNRTQYGPNVTDTPFGPYMYDASTQTKWWGLTTVLISWDILREKVTRLDELEMHGYDYVLSRPVASKELLKAQRFDLANSTRPHELAVAWSDKAQEVPANATNNGVAPRVPGKARPLVYYDLHERLLEPVSQVVEVEGAQLTLFVSLAGGWTPGWKRPMVAVTVVLSVLISIMLFLVLANRRQHMRLLHAMIPKKVVSTLRRGKIFTESFEVVTVLFSDIVAYTTMSAQMAPIEVVQMLDELYQAFDNLAEKHRLYKLDTIGDAIMLVGGAPDTEGAAAAAARVAQMGLDMIRVTSTKVLAGGHVVKIRVGIHSGPAVAAVVGRKAPKYTLFGDTVNTASRMESNGSPMRIHISGATAELLSQAGGFIIEPRGEIPIKGKGVMFTHWVTGTHVWSQGPCPRQEAVDISHITAPPPGTKIPENPEAEDERAPAPGAAKLLPISAPAPVGPGLGPGCLSMSVGENSAPGAAARVLATPPGARSAQPSSTSRLGSAPPANQPPFSIPSVDGPEGGGDCLRTAGASTISLPMGSHYPGGHTNGGASPQGPSGTICLALALEPNQAPSTPSCRGGAPVVPFSKAAALSALRSSPDSPRRAESPTTTDPAPGPAPSPQQPQTQPQPAAGSEHRAESQMPPS
ncbi:hypothetical protein PLESTB_000098000 [Pleodorina starrii]|uniref:Guanylate cyclase domain-containing protein n=1 Tax=Pleodorina starrii TaxID=330485 RepID=A0A9W6BAE6_9CHLO|nr:hypothetical protein PLESTM_000094500 [Pleodorina starrii]GLC48439.1 hypothetical protein PLESTB_000098000 [Pleodorina starrii]GLC71761.1 hypothetical protein PLESTF_001163800 [Pleodorina starrii]